MFLRSPKNAAERKFFARRKFHNLRPNAPSLAHKKNSHASQSKSRKNLSSPMSGLGFKLLMMLMSMGAAFGQEVQKYFFFKLEDSSAQYAFGIYEENVPSYRSEFWEQEIFKQITAGLCGMLSTEPLPSAIKARIDRYCPFNDFGKFYEVGLYQIANASTEIKDALVCINNFLESNCPSQNDPLTGLLAALGALGVLGICICLMVEGAFKNCCNPCCCGICNCSRPVVENPVNIQMSEEKKTHAEQKQPAPLPDTKKASPKNAPLNAATVSMIGKFSPRNTVQPAQAKEQVSIAVQSPHNAITCRTANENDHKIQMKCNM